MKATATIFYCSKCDAQAPKWQGRCSECGAWGTMLAGNAAAGNHKTSAAAKPIPGSQINLSSTTPNRLATGIAELDRVFGGGLVPGSLTLLGGEPGIGKSTIAAQIADQLPAGTTIVYASGEESVEQVAMRLQRLGCDINRLSFLAETDIEAITNSLAADTPQLLIIDSIQTVRVSSEGGETGGISQIRAAAVKLLEFAKRQRCAVIIIGHITKDGQIAGPKTLEHLVDTVIYLEHDGSQSYRLLRATKNRFGATNEIGIFEMTGRGLKPIDNPGALFLDHGCQLGPGSLITAISEGSRQFLIEVQALTNKTVFGYPQRRSSGFDANRLQVLAAVMSKRARINLAAHDIILNVVGGLKINDPGADLAVCLAIASSLEDYSIDRQTLVLGEVGLSGEIRPVPRLEAKLKEAAKLGFVRVIAPGHKSPVDDLEIHPVSQLSQAIAVAKQLSHRPS